MKDCFSTESTTKRLVPRLHGPTPKPHNSPEQRTGGEKWEGRRKRWERGNGDRGRGKEVGGKREEGKYSGKEGKR